MHLALLLDREGGELCIGREVGGGPGYAPETP